MNFSMNDQVALRNLWFNETIKEAIDAPRIHHQLFPMELAYECGTPRVWPSEVVLVQFLTAVTLPVWYSFYYFLSHRASSMVFANLITS